MAEKNIIRTIRAVFDRVAAKKAENEMADAAVSFLNSFSLMVPLASAT